MSDLLPLETFLPLRVDEIPDAYPRRSEWEVWTAGDDDIAFQVALCADREMAEAIAHYGRELLQRAYPHPDGPKPTPSGGTVE